MSYKNQKASFWVTLVLAGLASACLQAAQFSADAVKAAYLFRFASYVEWPPESLEPAAFTIGVIGAEEVAVQLERLLNGKSVAGKPVRLKRVRTSGDLDGVHILYVSTRAFRGSRPLREAAIKRPILMVTDIEDGLDGGGVINFIEVDRNLRFEISLNAADRCGLKIDSALLAVAARVETRPQPATGRQE